MVNYFVQQKVFRLVDSANIQTWLRSIAPVTTFRTVDVEVIGSDLILVTFVYE